MSSGSSWPSYLPPSSIAFCAACASVMLPPGPGDALVRHLVLFGIAAVNFRGNLLQLPDRVGSRRMRRARMRVRRLAAARDAAPRQVLAVLPQVSSTFSHGMPTISAETRWQSLIDSVPRLPMPDWMYMPAVGLDDEQAVVAGRSRDEGARGDAVAADLRALTLAASHLALGPLELLGAAIERFLDEGARRMGPLASRIGTAEHGLAFRRVDAMDGHLIDVQLPRRLGEDRLHQHDALHAARLTLRAARRRVGQH